MTPTVAALNDCKRQERVYHLRKLIAGSEIYRPRRPRVAPRVVKVNRSGYRTKKAGDKSEKRDFLAELTIVFHPDFKLEEETLRKISSKQKHTVAHKLLRLDPYYHNKCINNKLIF